MGKLIDITGQTFERWTVICRVGNKGTTTMWACLCKCGTKAEVAGGNLRNRYTKSCGCWNMEARKMRKPNWQHGMTKSPEFNSWRSMKKRCLNPTHQDYHRYGGRGITVCDRWRNSFSAFLKDMGPKPGLAYSIERINNELGYSKENCIWADPITQSHNRRTTVNLSFWGKTQCLTVWSRELNISQQTLSARIKRGWDPIRALLTPLSHPWHHRGILLFTTSSQS